MKKHHVFLIILAISWGAVACAQKPQETAKAPAAEYAPIAKPTDADISLFREAYTDIQAYYVEPVDSTTLFENAVDGMIGGLDPHSAFLNTAEYAELMNFTQGEFAGIGLEVTMIDGFIQVITPIDGSPAQKAGLKSGDTILLIDDTPVQGMSLQDAVDKIRGKKGTKVTLTFVHKDSEKPETITLTRDNISLDSVRSELIDGHYGYIRVSSFQDPTPDDVKKAIDTLNKESKNSLQGVILDLRNNPGGVLESAVGVTNLFLNSATLPHDKLIVYTKGRFPQAQIKAYANGQDLLQGKPLIVLINGGSASGAEIVAGALQDDHRAVVLGTQSFGKGSVQTLFPLPGNRAAKITTALYYTPAGRSIQAEGIKPDIVVDELAMEKPPVNAALERLQSINEQALKGHLKNQKALKKAGSETLNSDALLYDDFQLYEAVIVLKGMNTGEK